MAVLQRIKGTGVYECFQHSTIDHPTVNASSKIEHRRKGRRFASFDDLLYGIDPHTLDRSHAKVNQ